MNLNTAITTGFMSLLTSMISNLVILYTIDFHIFMIAFCFIFVLVVSRLVYFSKHYLPSVQKAQEYYREYNGVLNDAVLNFTSLKVYRAVETFSKQLRSKKEEANYYRNKASIHEFSFGAFANVVYTCILFGLMIYSVGLFEQNLMTLGSFIFFINAMIALKRESTQLTWSYIQIGEILVKLKNSYELLYGNDDKNDESHKQDIQITTGDIEFKDMSFKYRKNYIFENFDLKIPDKQKLGIIGVSGSGKTTLVSLFLSIYYFINIIQLIIKVLQKKNSVVL